MTLPILVYHRGKQKYVKAVLEQAAKYHDKVILIGNDANKDITKEWIYYKRLDHTLLNAFKNAYVHMSNNPYQIEMFCFESWFYYYECAKSMGFHEFIAMDSDVLLYKTIERSDFGTADVAMGWNKKQEPYVWAYNPFFTFWKLSELEDYLHFCIEAYAENSVSLNKLHQKWLYHRENGQNGGICDMTLMYLWAQDKQNIMNVVGKNWNGAVFDLALKSNVNYEQNFEYDEVNKIKKVKFVDEKKPCFIERETGRLYPVIAIHCISDTKIYINMLLKGIYNTKLFALLKFWNRLMGKGRQIIYYLNNGGLFDRVFKGKRRGILEDAD